MSETNKQPETVERSGQAPFAGLIGSANFDGETVEAALKRTEATACAMKEPDCSDVLAAEVRKLRTALKDANDLCRSAYQVAMREGHKTNWPAFRACLSESLDRQHRVMYPPKDQGWKCDLGNGQWDHDWQEMHDSAGEVDGGPGDHWAWRECRECGAIESPNNQAHRQPPDETAGA